MAAQTADAKPHPARAFQSAGNFSRDVRMLLPNVEVCGAPSTALE
jgi:hypothetical protein